MINKIHNESCELTLEKIEDNFIDGVITSPPYNIIRPNSTDRGYDVYKDGMTNEEYINFTLRIFNQLDRVMKKDGVVVYNMSYGAENTEAMSLTVADIIRNTNFTLADIIVWKKDSATPNNVSKNRLTRIVEFVYVFCRKDELMTFNANKKVLSERDTGQKIFENVFNFIMARNNDGSTDLNKATYSTELVTKLLKIYFKENSVVYDPFMGTGTTAVSVINHKCDFIGSELSEAQTEYANERIKKALGNVGLFA